MPVIEVRGLTKRFGEVLAVDQMSFEVEAGSVVGFLGPNGAGKTTTVSILTTTLAPASGRVRIAGRDLATDQATARRELGIVFQQPSLDLNLTAEENIRLHAVLYGLYPWRPMYRLMAAGYRRQVQEMAGVLDLSDILGQRARALSGGLRRRLEIIRSLMHRPAVLFLDEPTAGLDPESRRSLWAYLRHARAASRASRRRNRRLRPQMATTSMSSKDLTMAATRLAMPPDPSPPPVSMARKCRSGTPSVRRRAARWPSASGPLQKPEVTGSPVSTTRSTASPSPRQRRRTATVGTAIRSARAARHAACEVTRSVTTVSTGISRAWLRRARTAAPPVSGWKDTMAAGSWAATASATGRSARASSVRCSSHITERESQAW
jgi:ABC-type Na+ transport system ATPase subunit NatA